MKATTRISALAAAAAVALALSACGGGGGGNTGGGGSAAPIKIGIIADLTGATGDVGKPYNEGMLGYIDWVNAKGGISGRKIEAMSNDYAYKVPTAEEPVQEVTSPTRPSSSRAGAPVTRRRCGPRLPPTSSRSCQPSYAEVLTDVAQSPYNFVVAPTYSDQMRVALNWIAKDAGGKAEVAVFHNDSPFGTAPLADGQKWIAEKGLQLGFKAVPDAEGHDELHRSVSAGAEPGREVHRHPERLEPGRPGRQGHQGQRAGHEDRLPQLVLRRALHQDRRRRERRGSHPHPAVRARLRGQARGTSRTTSRPRARPLTEKGVHYAQGWYTMAVAAKGIEKALAAGGDLTGEAIRKALETMDAVDTGGVVGTGTVKFSADSHRGSTGTGIYQVKGGTFAEIAANQVP